MLKKLQNLLFEDEEDYEEDEELDDTLEQPVVKTKKAEPVAVTPAAPVVEKPVASSMQRIDVTQPVQFPDEPVVSTPAPKKNESVFLEPEAPKANLGIKADAAPKASTTKKAAAPVAEKPAETKKTAHKTYPKSTYEFQPVISPIFGVDEKDMDALKTTTTKINEREKAKQNENTTPVISPMYGTSVDNAPNLIQNTVEKSNLLESLTGTSAPKITEDEIPEFSLDDILKVRDDSFSNLHQEPAESEEDASLEPLFPDLTLDEPEDAKDTTVVLKRPTLNDED